MRRGKPTETSRIPTSQISVERQAGRLPGGSFQRIARATRLAKRRRRCWEYSSSSTGQSLLAR
jgi:hypothetical protein